MDKYMVLELVLMLVLGIRWEVVIKVNPQMLNSKAYSFYHENKYKASDDLELALKMWAVKHWKSM